MEPFTCTFWAKVMGLIVMNKSEAAIVHNAKRSSTCQYFIVSSYFEK
jgi:hypothetical protein